jgi:hypothetical protein
MIPYFLGQRQTFFPQRRRPCRITFIVEYQHPQQAERMEPLENGGRVSFF